MIMNRGKILLAVALLSVAGCGVSKAKYKKQVTMVEQLTQEKDSLQGKMKDLQTQITKLKKDTAQMQGRGVLTESKKAALLQTYAESKVKLKEALDALSVMTKALEEMASLKPASAPQMEEEYLPARRPQPAPAPEPEMEEEYLPAPKPAPKRQTAPAPAPEPELEEELMAPAPKPAPKKPAPRKQAEPEFIP